MRPTSSVVGPWVAVACLAIFFTTFCSQALAQTVNVALNVRYNSPGDVNSGGTWRLVARSSPETFGLAGLQVTLASISGTPQAAGPIGVVNGNFAAGFSEFQVANSSGDKLIVLGQKPRLTPLPQGQEQTLFYGVGTLNNGAPNFPGKPAGSNSIGPAFNTLTQTARIPWATPFDTLNDPLWSTAAGLASGSFAAGVTPSILGGSANVYTSLTGNNVMVTGSNFILNPNRIVQGLPGDYNGNNVVDAADYTVWRDHFGQMFQLTNEGPDTPGEVTSEDYTFWKSQFGASGAAAGNGAGAGSLVASTAGSVPEPTALALLLGGAGIAILPRKCGFFCFAGGPRKKRQST